MCGRGQLQTDTEHNTQALPLNPKSIASVTPNAHWHNAQRNAQNTHAMLRPRLSGVTPRGLGSNDERALGSDVENISM